MVQKHPRKTQTCPSTGMAWDSVLETERLFFTLKLTHRKEKKTNKTGGPYAARDMLLRQIYFGFLIHVTQPLALVHNTYPKHTKKQIKRTFKNKKACNHTQGGRLCTPAVGHTVFSTLPPGPRRCPSTITHRNVFTQNNNNSNKNKKGAVSECMLQGERGEGRGGGGIKIAPPKWPWQVKKKRSGG